MSDRTVKVEGGGGGYIALVILLIWVFSGIENKIERAVDAYECQVYGLHERCTELIEEPLDVL